MRTFAFHARELIPLAALIVNLDANMAAVINLGCGHRSAVQAFTVRSGLRQLVLGGAAALVTFGIGHLIGASVS